MKMWAIALLCCRTNGRFCWHPCVKRLVLKINKQSIWWSMKKNFSYLNSGFLSHNFWHIGKSIFSWKTIDMSLLSWTVNSVDCCCCSVLFTIGWEEKSNENLINFLTNFAFVNSGQPPTIQASPNYRGFYILPGNVLIFANGNTSNNNLTFWKSETSFTIKHKTQSTWTVAVSVASQMLKDGTTVARRRLPAHLIEVTKTLLVHSVTNPTFPQCADTGIVVKQEFRTNSMKKSSSKDSWFCKYTWHDTCFSLLVEKD